MAELSQLDMVRLAAERITLKRIQEEREAKAWQEAKSGTVTLDESVEATKKVSESVVEPVEPEVTDEPKPVVVKTKKGK